MSHRLLNEEVLEGDDLAEDVSGDDLAEDCLGVVLDEGLLERVTVGESLVDGPAEDDPVPISVQG